MLQGIHRTELRYIADLRGTIAGGVVIAFFAGGAGVLREVPAFILQAIFRREIIKNLLLFHRTGTADIDSLVYFAGLDALDDHRKKIFRVEIVTNNARAVRNKHFVVQDGLHYISDEIAIRQIDISAEIGKNPQVDDSEVVVSPMFRLGIDPNDPVVILRNNRFT